MSKKTYEDFANAFYQLKIDNNDVSYGKISLSIGVLESTINALVNRKRSRPPTDKVIKKLLIILMLNLNIFMNID